MNNMQQILARAQKLQAKVTETQNKLANEEISGTSGSGMVSITMTVNGSVKSISVNKDIINPDEKDILEDLILAAFNDAKQKADTKYEEEMKKATGGMNIPGF